MRTDDLTGKTAVVTGAASGIGRETSLALARRGADLAICDVDESGLEETAATARELGRRVVAARVDVAKLEEMHSFAESVLSGGDVDILVNNAGVGLGGGFLDTTIEDWRWIVDINLWGVVHGCHCFVPAMVDAKRGGPWSTSPRSPATCRARR
jgi:NAD(P)-dependent dehydrogenase (short-subunit alcohol dehydrogenase family)